MTSNIGARQLKDFGQGVGFLLSQNKKVQKNILRCYSKCFKKAFAPEFLNRIDDVVCFNSLS